MSILRTPAHAGRRLKRANLKSCNTQASRHGRPRERERESQTEGLNSCRVAMKVRYKYTYVSVTVPCSRHLVGWWQSLGNSSHFAASIHICGKLQRLPAAAPKRCDFRQLQLLFSVLLLLLFSAWQSSGQAATNALLLLSFVSITVITVSSIVVWYGVVWSLVVGQAFLTITKWANDLCVQEVNLLSFVRTTAPGCCSHSVATNVVQ